MQFTNTMVRVATVEDEQGSGSGGRGGTKHWTVDLSFDPNPIASNPSSLPSFRGSTRNLFAKHEGVDVGSTTIIGGGVLWCRRGDSVNLILVTSTSVLVYEMNTVKKQMIKTQVFPLESASSFWYEPKSRTLIIGSYKKRRSASEEDVTSDELPFPNVFMEMKTLFFADETTVDTFPTFSVGTLRELVPSDKEDCDTAASENDEDRSNVVLPTDISVVNCYDKVFCVELGSLGFGQGIGLTELNRDSGSVEVRQHVSS
jgi:hypothetical protein